MIKLLLGGLVAVFLLIGFGVGGYFFFRQWEGRHLVRRAQAFLSGGDSKSALLSAKRALQLNPSNAEACRLLAQIAEQTGQPSAIEWRQRVMANTSTPTEDEIALAKTALQFGEISIAQNALSKVGPSGDHLPTYHEVTAQLALAKQDSAAAEKHYAEAVRLDPSNKSYQFNLATLQLQSSSPEIRSAASKLLQQLMQDEALRAPAARALRDYAAQRNDVSVLLELAEQLHGYPEATFRDRMSYVQILHLLDRPQFAAKLTDLQNEALADPSKLTDLLSWMTNNGLAMLAIHWIKGLPFEVLSQRPVPLAVADCYIAVNDWDSLQQWCKKGNWGDLDFLRHAYLSRVSREQGDNLGSRSEWNAALQAAGSDGERLYALERGASKWGWKKEAEDLLWTLAKDKEKQNAALATLYQHYIEKGDTANLYRVAARLCEMKPDDDKAQNNFAQLSLLLSVNVEQAHEHAEQLYRKDPKNPVFASTYGFSLYRKGKYQQAAKAMSDLAPTELENPAIAAYYGVFLAAAGDKSRASDYLERGSQAPLLPEEKLLLENARNQIARSRP